MESTSTTEPVDDTEAEDVDNVFDNGLGGMSHELRALLTQVQSNGRLHLYSVNASDSPERTGLLHLVNADLLQRFTDNAGNVTMHPYKLASLLSVLGPALGSLGSCHAPLITNVVAALYVLQENNLRGLYSPEFENVAKALASVGRKLRDEISRAMVSPVVKQRSTEAQQLAESAAATLYGGMQHTNETTPDRRNAF